MALSGDVGLKTVRRMEGEKMCTEHKVCCSLFIGVVSLRLICSYFRLQSQTRKAGLQLSIALDATRTYGQATVNSSQYLIY